ncbi:hypothetical protein GCK32_022572 [Trichostrongylus colubriformis]|uniref:Uncharacterized protein n=1 Tax=Trichostrongylus colubriformis TaxID=6319 RepID=A0AAN8FNW8_TRICO
MVKPTLKTEIGPPMSSIGTEANLVKPTNTTPENVSRRSRGSLYKHDLEERLRESLDRIKSKSFDDVSF